MAADLFAPKIESPMAPNGRSEPKLWVRRLVIFKDQKDVKSIIRDVKLAPGINIVWTPDMSNSGNNALAHGSGKTTFCRLLRACLGEQNFANETQRLSLMTNLPNGLVAAEVMIEGECWVSVRCFGFGEISYVKKANSIEDAISEGRKENDPQSIDHVIINTFFSTIIKLIPQEIEKGQIWDVIRAWLSRDQECRLADILSWRTTKTHTQSRAQTLSENAKLTMVRLALKAIDEEERTASIEERRLASLVDSQRKRNAYLEQRNSEILEVLRDTLRVGDDIELEDTLDRRGLVTLAEDALSQAMRVNLPVPPDGNSYTDILEGLYKDRSDFEGQKNSKNREAERKRNLAQSLRSEANLGAIDLQDSQVRVCQICRVPVDKVLAEGCGISLVKCDTQAIRDQINQKQIDATLYENEAASLDLEVLQLEAQIKQIGQKIQNVTQQSKEAEAKILSARHEIAKIQEDIYQARRLVDDARKLRQNKLDVQPVDKVGDQLEQVRLQMENGRKRSQRAIGLLEERYKGIISDWLPDGVDGSIKLDGKGLKVDAQFSGRGEVSTAALDSLKIVAFDLAALHLAVEEQASLPAFLIHDSPREADLDGTLYERLFKLVRNWQTGEGPTCFQYVITTTTSPPVEMQGEEFVKLKMSSTPHTQRLFGMDL